MTDKELASYEVLPCPICGSEHTNVRYAGQGWYYVGCYDCGYKRTCDEANIDYAVELWNGYARRCGK